jgi:hydroxyethylthiazole kinase-like uncharacterized protein yjeF
MSTNSERIVRTNGVATHSAWPLHDVAHTRLLEQLPSRDPSASTLMQAAGLAVARLTLALAPHGKTIWIACGPGNNGGDGIEAARHLHAWGKQVVVTMAHDLSRSTTDARCAWEAAQAVGVTAQTEAPKHFDVCLDAVFGIGAQRPLHGAYAEWVGHMNASPAPTIAVDAPTGLDADCGTTQTVHVKANHTLSLLTLKPGLFTNHGRDACGEVWFNTLDVQHAEPPQAWLSGPQALPARHHASHKGSFGDVAVVGGAEGMGGAAVLTASSALLAGAGRVFVCVLDAPPSGFDSVHPELMFRRLDALPLTRNVVIAGCGGGLAIANALPHLLQDAQYLVLDADALNHIADNGNLQALLATRGAGRTVMTPHPLEAARLLGSTVAQVQSNRLEAVRTLAQRYQCTVVLKGSGTVIAAPGTIPLVNPTGNAKLATAGTGDVLAGLIGAHWAQGMAALDAAASAAYRHGLAAEHWINPVLTASGLIRQL